MKPFPPIRAAHCERSPYLKHLLLLLLSVVIPSIALVVLSLRMMVQERELTEKRVAERRELLGRQFGEVLDRQLREAVERIPSAEVTPRWDGEQDRVAADVVLVARVAEDTLILPWEEAMREARTAEDLETSPLAESLAAGRRSEFGGVDLATALAHYREAARMAVAPLQQARISLALARVLFQTGAIEEAEAQLQPVLDLPPSLRDEFGVPLRFYAAGLLLNFGRHLERALSAVAGPFEEAVTPASVPIPDLEPAGVVPPAWSPAALCMARDYLESLRGQLPTHEVRIETHLHRLSAQLARYDQAEQLKSDFPVVRATLNLEAAGSGLAGRWTLYGTDPWLVSLVSRHRNDESTLLAVHAGGFVRRILADDPIETLADTPRLVPSPHPEGVALGETFANVQVILPVGAPGSLADGPQRPLYLALIVLVLGITLFGAHLWWRDTRRELELAEMRSDFVSGVSHELKTPLTSVQMLAETLRLRKLPSKERNEYLDLILSESERLGRLLKNVLDFSQIEKGTKVYQLEPVELWPVVEAAIRLVQRPLGEKNLTLDVPHTSADLVPNADRDALEQALLNLLYNAIKYSHKDGRIELRVERVGGEAVIQVRDYGVGIQPRDQQRIFERFYRTPEDHNRRIPGTGLGLALVKHIVESHGGRVTVESAPAQGSNFMILLPALAEA